MQKNKVGKGKYQFETRGARNNKMTSGIERYLNEQWATMLNKRSNSMKQKEQKSNVKQMGQQVEQEE